MAIAGLDHVTINTDNLDATERFYVDVVGLERAPRPDLGIPGIWLKAAGEGPAIIHVIGMDAHERAGTARRSAVDHIALHARDFERARGALESAGLPWRGNIIADFGLWQLMVYDPNGVLIELNFKARDEVCQTPAIPAGRAMTLENFFNPAAYGANFEGPSYA